MFALSEVGAAISGRMRRGLSFCGTGRKPLDLLSAGSQLLPQGRVVHQLCPTVSRDGKYLFFLRNTPDGFSPHWVGASVIDEYR